MSNTVQADQVAIALPDNPFPGIDPYSYSDRNIFFGRDTEGRDLIRLVVMYRGVLLFSDSGSGKSSLINARLVPLAIKEGYQPERIRVQPKKGKEIVVERIAETATGKLRALPSLFFPDENAERQILSVQDFLKTLQPKPISRPPLLIFDQFEEWITLFEENATREAAESVHQAQAEILDAIVTLLRDTTLSVKVLISLREDYVAKLTPLFQRCPALPDQYLRLTSLKVTQIAGLIRKPFEAYPEKFKREINAALAHEIQKDFQEKSSSGAARLTEVQIVCQSLFESGLETIELPSFFEKQGRVEGVLIDYLERALHSLSPELREPAICLLGRMVTVVGTRNVIQEDDLLSRVEREQSFSNALLKQALENLESKTKLVRREPRQNVYYYEITSEFLISWIQAKFQALQQRLEQEQKDQARKAEQKTKRRRLQLTFLGVAVVVLAGMVFGYWRLARNWSRQAREADSRRLALFAHDVSDTDSELSVLLALQATKKTYDANEGVTPEAENALREAIQKARLQALLYGHIGVIRDLVFSPDGNRLATASDDGTTKIWDANHGNLLHTLYGHKDAVLKLAFDPSERFIATASRDGTIRLWDLSSGQAILKVTDDGNVLTLAFSRDGNQLAAVMDDNTVNAWNVASGETLSTTQITAKFGPLGAGQYAPLPRAGTGETLVFQNGVFGRMARTLRGIPPAVNVVTQSRDGQRLATASTDGTVKLWNAQSGRQLAAFAGQRGVTKLVFTADKDVLAAASADGIVNLWDTSSGRLLYILHSHQSALSAIAFSPDGKQLATAGENEYLAELWDVSSRNSASLPLPSVLTNLAVSPDGKQLAGTGADQSMTLWDTSTGAVLHTLNGAVSGGSLVVFSRDGKRLATGSRDGMLDAWDLNSGTVLFPRIKAHTGLINAIVFTSDGSQIITAGADNHVNVWNASSGQQLNSFGVSIGSGTEKSFTLSPDGTHLASLDQQGALKIIDVNSGNESHTISEKGVVTLCFNYSGQQLATWDPKGGVQLWKTSSGELVRSFGDTAGMFYRLRFTSDDKQLIAFNATVASSSAWIKMWDTDSGRLVHSILQHPDGYLVAVTSDATRLVALTYVRSTKSGTNAQQPYHLSLSYLVNTYPLAIKDLINLADSRIMRSISSQECRSYYLSGPQCKAADLVEDASSLAQAGNIDAATAEIRQAKELDPLIPFDPSTEARRLATEPILGNAQTLARNGDLPGAAALYERAKQLDPNIKVDSETEARRVAARSKVDEGDLLLSQGVILEALNAYQKALELNPQSSILSRNWNSICWYGALIEHAKEVMPACERAVTQASTNGDFYDSRGVARALTGNKRGAIEDFEVFLKSTPAGAIATQRREWVAALEAGQNPFTPEVLQSLLGQ